VIYNSRVVELYTREQLRAELIQVGAESSALDEQVARGTFRLLRLDAVPLVLARLLYQELVMEGGQVVTAARLEHVGEGTTDVLLCATRYQFEHLIVRLRWQPSEELQLLADELEQVLDNVESRPTPALVLGGRRFEWGARTYLMGILNVTPNSFSGDGLIQPNDTPADYATVVVARAVARAKQMAAEGADILDIGGESTHPEAQPVDAATELARVLPVVQALAREVSLPLSIDTYKAEVARAALQAGAVLVNDVWGLRRDPELKRVVAETRAAVVINHNWLAARRASRSSTDFIGDIIRELRAQVETAREAGLAAEKILIDPGLGFGKSVEQSLALLERLDEFKALGLPILIGPSRKGFISRVLDVPNGERDAGTAAVVVLGIARGADVIRVHDVKVMARVAKMTDAIVRGRHVNR
jgi:dihydropteroate synthase